MRCEPFRICVPLPLCMSLRLAYAWQAEGHEWVGLFVARMFGKRTAVGRIKKWVPADGEDGA